MTAITYTGKLLPYQLIFAGKTAAVLPSDVHPAPGSFYSCTPSHFANACTTLEWAKKILVPFLLAQRQARIDKGESTEEVEKSRWATLIWDNFSAHADDQVKQLLESHRIKSFFLPPNCTSKYQVLDVLFNGYEKVLLKTHFSEWHFRTLEQAMSSNPDAINVLPWSAAKKRTLIATLIRGVHEILEQKAALILKAWDLTKLFDEDRGVDENIQEVFSNDIVVAMNDLMLIQDDNTEDENLEQIEANPILDAPDADEHRNTFAMEELEESFELEDNELSDHTDDDGDLEFLVPPHKRPSLQDEADSVAESELSTGESTHTVHVQRSRGGGALQVTFGSNFRAPAERVVQVLRNQGVIPMSAGLASTTEPTSSGYMMTLTGVAHGTVSINAPTLSWQQGTSRETI